MPSPPINQGSCSSLMARVAQLEKSVFEDSVRGDLATKIADQVLEKLPMKLQPLLHAALPLEKNAAKPPPAKPITAQPKVAPEPAPESEQVIVDAAPVKDLDADATTQAVDKGDPSLRRSASRLSRSASQLSATGRGPDRKLTMACDHDVDTSMLRLQDEANLGSVFSHEADPAKPMFRVESFYYDKGCCQALARSSHFANITISVVILNAIFLGIDSDHNHASNIYDADWVFQAAVQFFSTYFTFELGVRFFAFAKKGDCLRDGWFKFDLFLVGTMILDVWVLMPIMKLITSGGDLPIPTQPLRMLRLFKLTRMARLMRAFPELVTMVKGLVRSLRAILSSMVLIFLMVYTWAILIHTILKDDKQLNENLYKDYQYDFTRLGDCVWTLLMAGTLMLDNAAPLMHTLLLNDNTERIIAGVIFVSYCVASALCVLQMVIGVLCDVVSQVGQERKDAETIGLIRQELLQDIFNLTEGDAYITSAQFEQVLDGERSRAVLKNLNINRMFLQQATALMFPDEQTKVSVRAILELMIMCRGDNIATVQIVASALCFITNELSDMQDQILVDLGGGDELNELSSAEADLTSQRSSHHSLAGKLHMSDAFVDGL